MSEYLRAQDAISGKEGVATVNVNGAIETLFYAKKIEAKIEKDKAELKVLGKRGTQHKTIGYNGTGSMTIYYVTDVFRNIMMDYVKNGIDTYFNLTITNHDSQSSAGVKTTTLYDCNIDSSIIALLDSEAEVLEEDLDFTFNSCDDIEKFNKF